MGSAMGKVLTQAELLAIKDVVVPLAEEVGRWAKTECEAHYRGQSDVGVSSKTSPGDVVTRVDYESQRRIAERLGAAYPGFGLLGEEGGLASFDGEAPVWVIDPIDGTHNFVRNYPAFCVSIGLVQGGESVLGAIYHAADETVTWAVKGAGTWRDGVRLERKDDRPLSHALAATNFTPSMVEEPAQATFFGQVAAGSAGMRASGACCRDFCFVADGRVDLFWQFGLSPWDVAAGMVIAREAGAVCEMWRGGEDWLRSKVAVATGTSSAVATARGFAVGLGLVDGG